MGISGYPPYLLRLKAGPILCVFGKRTEPRRICGILSYDDGKSWDKDNVLIIKEFENINNGSDIGYPIVLETQPGELFCIYYACPTLKMANYAKADPNSWGILSTRFTLK